MRRRRFHLGWPIRLIAVVALAYAAICVLMYVQQRQFIYLSQYTRIAADRTDYALDRGGPVLRGWRVRDGGERALIYFGGNAESLEPLRVPLADALPGHAVYLVAYRGYGASDGRPDETALFDDALALFDQVRSESPSRPIDVIGRSLGSGVASYLASQRPVSRLVLVTPFDSLASVAASHYPWLPVRWLLRDRFESAHYLNAYRGPLLVIRAGRDSIIPPVNTDRLLAAARTPPRTLDLPGAGHNFNLFADTVRPIWIAFLEPTGSTPRPGDTDEAQALAR